MPTKTRIAVLTAVAIATIGASAVFATADEVNRTTDVDDGRTPTCRAQTYLYGTVTAVNGNTVVIRSTGSAGIVSLFTSRARLVAHSPRPRPGLFARARGCFGERVGNRNTFRTNYLAIARNLAALRVSSSSDGERAEGNEVVHHANPAPPVTAGQPQPQTSAGGSCGGYRWATKTGADSDAGAVSLSPQPFNITQARSLRPAAAIPANGRWKPAETTVYRLTNVVLTSMYTEHDRDYHLIVKDGAGNSLTLESPDPSCAGGSAFLTQITAVRTYLDAHHPTPGAVLNVTGIGFYDSPGSGGLELHPLLSVCEGTDCSPTAMTHGQQHRTVAARK